MVKDRRYIKTKSINPLYLIIGKINGYFEEMGTLKLFPIDERKEIMNSYQDLQSKIRDLIRSISNNTDDYDEKCKKITFNPDDDFPLRKTIELESMIISIRSVFQEGNKYYPQGFLDKCLCEL